MIFLFALYANINETKKKNKKKKNKAYLIKKYREKKSWFRNRCRLNLYKKMLK